jgi:DNA mismatch repair protein MutS
MNLTEHPSYQTPLMKQYVALKQEAGDSALLFFRMGDFYELFGDDAIRAAPVLGVTLTSRDKKAENPVAMAGLPYHSAQGYIQKALNAGFKVAIAEQILPPGMTADQIKGIVERKIVRTFSPAVQFELSDSTNSAIGQPSGQLKYLATLVPNSLVGQPVRSKNEGSYLFCALDPATGTVRISEPAPWSEIQCSSIWNSVQHYINFSNKIPAEFLQSISNNSILIEEVPANLVADANAFQFLTEQYQKQALHPLIQNPAAQKGLAILIQYVLKSQGLKVLGHLAEPKALFESDGLLLGPNTASHLDLNDLFLLIQSTSTSMGARRLRQQMEFPLRDLSAIHETQAAVKELASVSLQTKQMSEDLKEVYDLERILGRVVTRLASPRDVYALGNSLQSIFFLHDRIHEPTQTQNRIQSKKLVEIVQQLAELKPRLLPLAKQITAQIKTDAPLHTRDGGIFEMGANPELDRLIELSQNGERFMIDLETRERDATGISSLKVKYNRVFGYFIEISSANLNKVPAHYLRKQTMVGGERFYTEELKKFEEEILTASQKQRALEQELFHALIDCLLSVAQDLKSIASTVAELDCLISLSQLAHRSGYHFPVITENYEFKIEGGRHPVVDEALKGKFVANDACLDSPHHRTVIITGPNMGGKSTYMRQLAQIIILGQMGAPVPARSAQWGVFNEIFTRIGAHDAIAKGQSTFMVEMVELAHILNHATDRSLVILDEIGRGTSTFDGMSVASSALKHLHTHSQARIVFATHYHELTNLESEHPGIHNAHMMVDEGKSKLTFLYEIAPGRSSKSFGIQVAELAGLPKSVIQDAWKVLEQLESGQQFQSEHLNPQLSLFLSVTASNELQTEEEPSIAEPSEIESEIAGLNINELRPLDALNVLSEIQKKIHLQTR